MTGHQVRHDGPKRDRRPIPTTTLDPPHSAASPVVPALYGAGSPNSIAPIAQLRTRMLLVP